MVHIGPISMCHYYVLSFCRRSFDDAKQELMQLEIKRVTLHIDVLAMQKCNLLLENELLSMRRQAMLIEFKSKGMVVVEVDQQEE